MRRLHLLAALCFALRNHFSRLPVIEHLDFVVFVQAVYELVNVVSARRCIVEMMYRMKDLDYVACPQSNCLFFHFVLVRSSKPLVCNLAFTSKEGQ